MHLLVSLLGFFSAAFLLTPALGRAAPADDARQTLETAITDITTALRTPSEQTDLLSRLDSLTNRYFAFTTTTRLAMGPTWRDLTQKERDLTTVLFSHLIIRTYAERLRSETATVLNYGTPTELRAGRVEVPTKTRNGSQTYSIAYRLELADGKWRIYDVIAEGVSLVGNYRAQFEPVLAKGGVTELIRALQTQLATPAP